MLPLPEGSQCVSVSHDTGSWPDVWPRTRFIRQGASCGGPHGPLGLGSVITVFGAVKNAQFSDRSFKIKLSCRQKLRHEPSNEHVKCAVRTSLSRSGAKIVLSPARCGQDIGSITGSWVHNEPLHRSSQWAVHYRWQTEQSERRMLK